MKVLAYAVGGVLLTAIVAVMAYAWVHNTYTVGVDLNWKAIAFALAGATIILTGVLVMRRLFRGQRN